jgi:protein tyrosine/serine phosphatase
MISDRSLLNIKPNTSDYISYYNNILEVNSLLIKQILINLSQISYGENCCISCFAGKDRTGVLAYIIQKILNYDVDEIKESYVQSGKELSENILLFKENAYKKKLSLNEYAERFAFGELIFYSFDNYFVTKYGNIECYLETLGVNRVYINQIIKIFGDKNDL